MAVLEPDRYNEDCAYGEWTKPAAALSYRKHMPIHQSTEHYAVWNTQSCTSQEDARRLIRSLDGGTMLLSFLDAATEPPRGV